ncbi:MAG: FemAB family PEP-CTERM system-associated protein [Methanotrichaceae archaeon]|nr:FemAB family PEP-CTERM system-associated protein [Methanotrichaceae archaeon]
MGFEVKEFKENCTQKWDNFVFKNCNTTFYHQMGWKKVVEETYNHKPHYLYCENDSGEMVGVLPLFQIGDVFSGKRLISVPFAPYCGACGENEMVENALVDEAIDLSQELGVRSLEIRGYSTNSGLYNEFKNLENYSTFEFDLSNGLENIWKNMERSVRKNIKKGDRYHIESTMERSPSAIAEFYDIYARRMRNLGTPVHDKRFFTNLGRLYPANFWINHAKLNDLIISSIFLLEFKDRLLGGWMSALEEYSSYAPTNFAYWSSIKYGCENGFRSFDFGRSLKNSGGHIFKKRWGSVEVSLSDRYYPMSGDVLIPQEKYGKMTHIWKRLPLRVTKSIGPKIRKYVV